MKILVLHYSPNYGVYKRKTIKQHLRCFETVPHQIYYYNTVHVGGIYSFLTKIPFDLVVYHYTFTSLKWNKETWPIVQRLIPLLKKLQGYKIAIPQDEYTHNDFINFFFKEVGIQAVFTCFFEQDWYKAYPPIQSGLKHYETVYAGYVDEGEKQNLQQYIKPHNQRSIDIGYRARKNPYWLGYFALRKWQISEQFLRYSELFKLKMDISNDDKDVFYGNDWYNFLANCRVTLGTEGGASMLDVDGSIREKVDKYMEKKPHATFEECEENCFRGLDKNIELYLISPRHFEACMTKTCQVLVEGNYNGVLEPNKHYIPVKADWSNIEEVLEKVKDIEYCEQIAEQAYQDIVASGKYTYHALANQILTHVNQVASPTPIKNSLKIKFLLKLINIRENYPNIWTKLYDFYRFQIRGLDPEKLNK